VWSKWSNVLIKIRIETEIYNIVSSKAWVNFINILQAAFEPIFFRRKITKQNFNYLEESWSKYYEKFSRKMLKKLKKQVVFDTHT